MKYTSTRNKNANSVRASEAVLMGISPDGGLYVPESFPMFDFKKNNIPAMNYVDLAFEILRLYFTDFTDDELKSCVHSAYETNFNHPLVAPVKKVGNSYFLELFHGRTLAFKDFALSILPYLMKTSAKKLGLKKEVAILTATSGDTGKAALEGFAGVDGFKIVVFYPHKGVSEVQKLQMVTQEEPNTCVIGVDSNFDATQTGVKKIFTDTEFNSMLEKQNFVLSSANSINIGRLLPQIVYYFYAWGQMVKSGEIKPDEAINFVVPTGNFGNILAGYYAKKMGLPIKSLLCASNSNKVLYDFFNTSRYDRNREFILTSSPSMDILISSNLERLLYDICGKNSNTVRTAMDSLSKDGVFDFAEKSSVIKSCFADENEVFAAVKKVYGDNGYVMDTHTGVAFAAYEKYLKETNDLTKSVIVSTASPYKFCADVLTAIEGDKDFSSCSLPDLFTEMSSLSNTDIPKQLSGLNKRKIRHSVVCDKAEMADNVKKFLDL